MYRLVLLCLLSLAALTACTTVKEVTLPDGTTGYNISCDGSIQTAAACMNKAGEICPGGYDVIAADSTSQPIVSSTIYGSYANNVITRDLYVRCRRQSP